MLVSLLAVVARGLCSEVAGWLRGGPALSHCFGVPHCQVLSRDVCRRVFSNSQALEQHAMAHALPSWHLSSRSSLLLRPLQVRGADAIRAFSENLVHPYHPAVHRQEEEAGTAGVGAGSNSLLEELRRQVQQQAARIAELEAQLAAAKR